VLFKLSVKIHVINVLARIFTKNGKEVEQF